MLDFEIFYLFSFLHFGLPFYAISQILAPSSHLFLVRIFFLLGIFSLLSFLPPPRHPQSKTSEKDLATRRSSARELQEHGNYETPTRKHLSRSLRQSYCQSCCRNDCDRITVSLACVWSGDGPCTDL